MNLLYKYNWLWLVFLFFFSMCDLASAGNYKKQQKDVSVFVEKKASHELHKGTFGVHGALLWSSARYGSKKLVKIFQDLGFYSVRFPGGTDANYYLWRNSTYGCKNEAGKTLKAKKRISQFNRSFVNRGEDYTTKNFLSFIEDSSANFTLVINILCDSVEDAVGWLEYFHKNNIDVNKVELGNELYYEEYSSVFPEPLDYLRRAESFSKSIKRFSPNIKIGMVVSSSSYRSKIKLELHSKLNKRHKRGVEFDKLVAASKFADAMVIHLYSDFGVTLFEKNSSLFAKDEGYKRAISHFDTRAPYVFNYLSSLALDKELWVTEWGLAFYGDLRKYENEFKHSFLHGLFFSNVLIQLLKNDQITNANYHNFTNFLRKKNLVNLPAAYEVVKFLKEPILNSKFVADIEISGNSNYISSHPYFEGDGEVMVGIFLHSEQNAYLILINKFDDKFILNNVGFEGRENFKVSSLTVLSLSKDPAININDFRRIEENVDRSRYYIPPYSMSKIEFELAQ